MKVKTKLLMKITSIAIVAIMLMLSFASAVFAGAVAPSYDRGNSLADALKLDEDQAVDVIVEFTSPSLLELNVPANSPEAALYEQKLTREQNEVLGKLDIIPHYSYTGVINAVAITATVGEIRALERMRGVEDVYLSDTFNSPKTDQYQQNSASSPDIIGISSAVPSGYTGDGVLVAVLDSGITFEHEAFNNTKYVQNPALTREDLAALGFDADTSYYNEKIPFYRDYTGSTTEHFDSESGHGSHVAGIIGGYAENEDGTVKFSGIAPGVQICAMRVLNEFGGGTDAMIIAALEDAYKLNVDIINISFGRDSAFRLGGDQYVAYNGLYENLEKAGVMVVCSAGNFGTMVENTPRHVLDENCVDYGTLSLPAIYPGNVAVGSVSNSQVFTTVIGIGGESYWYNDANESAELLSFNKTFSGKTVDIAYFDNYGKQEDYVGVDVAGKIVAVKRGELSFTDKCKYAAEAGAVGLVVVNGENDPMGRMSISDQSIPAIMIEHAAVAHLPLSSQILSFGSGLVNIDGGGELSYFSAAGVTPDLEIGLDILGIGGTVFSVKSRTANEYIAHSGTSMAAPSVAGTYAIFYQMLKESEENLTGDRFDLANYTEDATQSTATILTDDFGYQYSPRFQGAGLINFQNALKTEAYITTPLVCLGYDANAEGKLSMEYELVSVSDSDNAYTVSVSAITDSFTQISPSDYKNNVTPLMLPSYLYNYSIYVNGEAHSADEAVTLPAGERVTVRIELELSPAAISRLSAAFPYGYFLDGFVEFYNVNEPTRSAFHGGYVSFMGDWLAGPAIEPLTQADVMDWIHSIGADIDSLLPYFAAGHVNANYSYTSLLVGDNNEYYIGQNPLADGAYIPSHEDRNAISSPFSDADNVLYDSLYLCPSLLRSCKSIRYVVADAQTGEIYATKTQSYVLKDIPYGEYQHFGMSDFTFDPVYSGPDEFGEISEQCIPSGTDVTISIYTLLDHPDATERLEAEFGLTIDYTAPELYYEYDAATKQLTLICSDEEYLAGIVLEAVDGQNKVCGRIDSRIYADTTAGLEHVEVFDLSEYDGDTLRITVADYASNTIYKLISLSTGNVSNIESSVTVGEGIEIALDQPPYLYQDVSFALTASEGYCFTDDFAVFINGQEIAPISVQNGVYYFDVTTETDELCVTAVGVAAHVFVPTVTKAPTCVGEGELSYVCSNCSCVGDVEAIAPSGHVGKAPVTQIAPSCETKGLATVSCAECGVIIRTQIISATGHAEGELVTVRDATCTGSGVKESSCLICQKVLRSEPIAATGHVSGEPAIVIEATCSSYGLSEIPCCECGAVISSTAIAPTQHTPAELVVTKQATCTDAGLGVVKCEECGAVLETSIISPTGHSDASGKSATAFSPAVCGVCQQSYGAADQSGIVILSLALSSVALLATVSAAIVILIKKKKG